MPEIEPNPRIEVTIGWGTIFKILSAILLAFLAIHLWRVAELMILALLIAIAFRPLVVWTRKRGWPHWINTILAALILFGSTALILLVIVPTIGEQGTALIKNLPQLREQALRMLPASGPVRDAANEVLNSPTLSNPGPLVSRILAWGAMAIQSLLEFFVVLVIAVYLVADGERVLNWLLAFFPERHRRKMADASPEIGAVVSHYMVGQVITSVLCGLYAFGVMVLLHVPNAALLGVMAAVFDVLPLIGVFLFAIPALGMALTVSPATAGLVGLLYGAYHVVENYFIVPKVYGDRLRLSTLTVLVCCLVGAVLAGVVGVIIILPIVACYPIIEKIWLRPYLEGDTVRKHAEIDAKAHPDKKE
jgi:predicted PurR-regulated permease PerM